MPRKQRSVVIFDDLFNIDSLQLDMNNAPIITDVIVKDGTVLPSPVKQYIVRHFGNAAYIKAREFDEKLRKFANDQTSEKTALYTDIENYIDIQISVMNHAIEDYDHFQNIYPLSLERDFYVVILPNIIRLMVDFHYAFITKTHRNHINTTLTPPGKPLLDRLDATLKKISALMDKYEAHYKKYKAICDETIPPEWTFRFYHTFAESLMFKVRVFHSFNKINLQNMGMSHIISKLDEARTGVDDYSIHFEYNFLRARYELNFNDNLKMAKEYATEAYASLPKNFTVTSDILTHAYMPLMLFRLDIAVSAIGDNPKQATVPTLMEAINVALEAKDLIEFGFRNHRAEFVKLFMIVFKLAIDRLHYELGFANKEALEKLLRFSDDTLNALPLLMTAANEDAKASVMASVELNKAAITQVRNKIENKLSSLAKEEAQTLAKIEEIEKLEAIYNEQFPKILKRFQTKVKKTTSVPRQSHEHTPVSTPMEIIPEVLESIKIDKREEPSFAVIARNYFESNTDQPYESLLDLPEAKENTAEALLYIGEKYDDDSMIDIALSYYEKAHLACQTMDPPNEMLMDSIVMQLMCVSDVLKMAIEKCEADKAAIETSRRNLFIKLGFKVLKAAEAPNEAFQLTSEENLKTILALGLEEFKRIGRENRAEGKPLSEKTIVKRELDAYLAFLHDTKEHSNAVLKAVKKPAKSATASHTRFFAPSTPTTGNQSNKPRQREGKRPN